jgi:hypothetical protein
MKGIEYDDIVLYFNIIFLKFNDIKRRFNNLLRKRSGTVKHQHWEGLKSTCHKHLSKTMPLRYRYTTTLIFFYWNGGIS